MTKLVDEGIEAVRGLPQDRQDVAGVLLLAITARDRPGQLTPEQIAGVREAQAQVARGEFAPDAALEALFGSRFG